MRRTRIGWTLVVLQFALLAVLVLSPRRALELVPAALGLAMALGGVALGLWSSRTLGAALTPTPVPIQGAGLRTGGAYAWVRHPIYSAVLLLAWGWTVAVGSGWTVAIAVTLTAFFVVKSRWEDRLLHGEYGDDWREWAARTGALVPKPRRRS